MTSPMTRRVLVQALAAAGTVAVLHPVQVRLTHAQSADVPSIGDPRTDFDAWFGSGTAGEDGLVHYGTPNAGETVYSVRFADEIADQVTVDLRALPGGGLPEKDADVGRSQFLPVDVQLLGAFEAGNMQFEAGAFNLSSYSSSLLAESSGRSGNVLVLDEHGVAGDGSPGPLPYTGALISMETEETYPITPQGDRAVLTASLDTWWDTYGQAGSAQRAAQVANPPVSPLLLDIGSADDSRMVREIDIVLESGISMTEAAEFVGLFLPADAMLEQTYYGVPTPSSPSGVRIHLWALPATQTLAMSLLSVTGDEETGTVDRILMAVGNEPSSD